jgi:competence protein ComEC
MKEAGVDRIDYMVISHYHGDHVGGVAALADKVPIRRVYDPGAFADELAGNRAAGFKSYMTVRDMMHVTLARPGMKIPVAGLEVNLVSAAGDLTTTPVPGVRRAANPLCAGAKEREQDNTPNNYESIGQVIEFGKFRYLDLPDLTWNQEMQLVCPQNLLGTFQLYRTSRHGTDWAGAEVLVHTVRPRVAVMNNNPTKGGTPGTFQIVRSSPGIEDFWQLHYSDFVSKDVNSPDNFIANFTKEDPGHHIKVTARSDGSFTVKNGRNGFTKEYRPGSAGATASNSSR